MEAVKLFSKSDAEAKIKELAKKRADGGPDRREQALQIAWVWGINKGDVHELFDDLGGCGCLNRISASISGASAGVRPPRGKAAS